MFVRKLFCQTVLSILNLNDFPLTETQIVVGKIFISSVVIKAAEGLVTFTEAETITLYSSGSTN